LSSRSECFFIWYTERMSNDSEADYQAVKQIAKQNGGFISQAEIFSVTVTGYCRLGRVVDRLKAEGVIYDNGYYIHEEDKPQF